MEYKDNGGSWVAFSSISGGSNIWTDNGTWITPTNSEGIVTTASSSLGTTTIKQWLSNEGNLGLDLTDDGSNLTLHGNVGGVNSFNIDTDGAFFNLIANPGPANDYLMASIAETQGATTELNFYEGGTGHNRFWNSGSLRIGGTESYLCSCTIRSDSATCV